MPIVKEDKNDAVVPAAMRRFNSIRSPREGEQPLDGDVGSNV